MSVFCWFVGLVRLYGVFFAVKKWSMNGSVDTAVDTQDVPGGYTPNVWGDPF